MNSYEKENKLKFDTIKIRTNINYFKKYYVPFNENYNHKTGKLNGIFYNSKFDNNIPFNLFVKVSYANNSLSIEFSSKILSDNYPKLISKETFKTCLENINSLGICELDVESIVKDCYFTKIHVTKDIDLELTNCLLNSLNSKVDNYRRYGWKHYENSGITFKKDVKSKDCTESITFYNKEKELEKSENQKFLNTVSNPDLLKKSFNNKTRIEIELDSMEKIRSYFEIDSTHIDNVFTSSANPILFQFDKIFGDIQIQSSNFNPINYDECSMAILIKYFNNDLKQIEQHFKNNNIYTSRSGLNNRMKSIKKINSSLLNNNNQCSTELINLRNKLI